MKRHTCHRKKETGLSTLVRGLPANSNKITIEAKGPAVLTLAIEEVRHDG